MDVAAEIGKILTVASIAFLSLWGAIPVGLALGLSPVVVIAASSISYAFGAALVLFVGEPARRWLYKRLGDRIPTDPNSRTRRILDRYSVVGLGAIAPVTLGSQIGALIGLMADMPRPRLLAALALGGLVWAVIFTMIFLLGFMTVQSVVR